MNYKEIKISELIPQQPPFVMVDSLTYFDEKNTETEMTVSKDNIFYDNNMLS